FTDIGRLDHGIDEIADGLIFKFDSDVDFAVIRRIVSGCRSEKRHIENADRVQPHVTDELLAELPPARMVVLGVSGWCADNGQRQRQAPEDGAAYPGNHGVAHRVTPTDRWRRT